MNTFKGKLPLLLILDACVYCFNIPQEMDIIEGAKITKKNIHKDIRLITSCYNFQKESKRSSASVVMVAIAASVFAVLDFALEISTDGSNSNLCHNLERLAVQWAKNKKCHVTQRKHQVVERRVPRDGRSGSDAESRI